MAALILLVAVLFQWNWIRGPLASHLSHELGRQVTINGDLQGEFSLHPLLTANDVTVANAAWATEPAMFRAKQAAMRVDLASLFRDSTSFPEITVTDASLLLERDAQGRESKRIPATGAPPAAATSGQMMIGTVPPSALQAAPVT